MLRDHPLILIADDQALLRQLLRRALERDGYLVQEAADGAQAVSICRQERPDIVLLDVVMPGTDGLTACAALRELPGGHTLPILMITGREDEETINSAFAAGADDYITKPCNMLVLRHRVRRLLEAEKRRKVIEHLATIDGLTGLLNRRTLSQRLRQAMHDAQHTARPLSIILLDIDHFKRINDTYGHQCGDQVLRSLSALLRRELKQQGFAGRYGGEEFLLVLPGFQDGYASMLAAKWLDTLCAEPLARTDSGTPLHVTASMGVTVLRQEPPDTFDSFLRRADEAMYEAKSSGRCRVCRR